MPPILKNVVRLDSTPMNPAFFTQEGYLKDRPILTSTGIFEYLNTDGSVRRELRLPEDVFDPDSLASYEGKPIIVTHDAGLVTKDNVHQFQIGTILTEGYKSGEDVRAKIIIHDTDEMKESGLKELSLGYNLDLDETPGTWNGERYDAIQRNIRINHLALVHEARAGEQARLNIDGRDTALKGGKISMSKRVKNAHRADSVLSPEELEKAIAEYKERRANQSPEKKDAEEVEEVKAEIPAPAEEPKAEPKEEPKAEAPKAEPKEKFEPEMNEVKENREQRGEAGEPEDLKKAKGIIADQDDDISVLFDIIDTLLAERDFDAAEEVPTEKPEEEFAEDEDDTEAEDLAEDECDKVEKLDEDDTEEVCEDEAEIAEEEELVEDEDDEIDEKNLNVDSVDAIVRQRIKLGMIGKQLNLDGLENMKVMTAKKKIIKAVRPKVRLDGKSNTYINAMFECAIEDVQKKTRKDTNYQKKQMFNKDSAPAKVVNSSDAARQRMIERRQNSNKEA